MGYRNVLDHGVVRLVDHMGSDLSVVRAARVSYDAAWRAGEDKGSDARLINYLWKNFHTTPFESVVFTFEVKAPIFVFRQWHRHRTWCLSGDSFLEFIRPDNAKPNKIRLDRLEATWNPKQAKRRRDDQSPLSLQEHNRKRISGMKLRCRGVNGEIETTQILDIWKSGVKPVYEIKAGGKTIKASADHLFFSQGEWIPVSQLNGRKVTLLAQAGAKCEHRAPEFTLEEWANEEWSSFKYGYDVSTLGRVRSGFKQGSRKPTDVYVEKKITYTKDGRAVVSINNKAMQVSRLVADGFLDQSPDKPFVLHRNDNPKDNRLTNLYRGTAQDNTNDCVLNGSRSKRAWVEYPVDSITLVGEEETYDVSVAHPEHCFVANNFLVHNCYNELSARYRELPNEIYIPDPKLIGVQSKDNKQMRIVKDNLTAAELEDVQNIPRAMEDFYGVAYAGYQKLIEQGVPRELARSVLPVATYSHMFATVNLLNLFKFLTLRCDPHAQYEIRVYAEAILELIRPIVPECVKAWEKNKAEWAQIIEKAAMYDGLCE